MRHHQVAETFYEYDAIICKRLHTDATKNTDLSSVLRRAMLRAAKSYAPGRRKLCSGWSKA